MAYIRLQGGLGNQLFIWSTAHYLSRITNKPIRIVCNPRNVHIFIEQLANISKQDIRLVRGKSARIFFIIFEFLKIKNQKLFELINFKNHFFAEQQNLEISREILSKALFIQGFFQRAWIVEEVWDILRREISEVSEYFSENRMEMLSEKTAMHVRRGDYVLSPNTWGLLSLQYYKEALGDLNGVKCFTDMDINQAKKFFENSPSVQILTPNDANEISVLLNLSKMNKLAIANSSLSWWGGFLASKKAALVIAPDPWFRKSDSWSNEIFCTDFIRHKSIFTGE